MTGFEPDLASHEADIRVRLFYDCWVMFADLFRIRSNWRRGLELVGSF